MGDEHTHQSDEMEGRPLRLLWIDDSARMRRAVELVAEEFPDEVTIVATITEARAALETGERFDWIVCDLLGGGSCEGFVRELAAQGRRAVILTDDPRTRPPGVCVLAKPIALPELLDALRLEEERLGDVGQRRQRRRQ